MTTVWGDDERYVKTYFSGFGGKLAYSTFDWAIREGDGYYFVLGRTDDVINVAGHRIGTRRSRRRCRRTRASPRSPSSVSPIR
jgi:propionyl-CoA synthetase